MATTIDSDINNTDVAEKHDDEHIRAIPHTPAEHPHRHASDTTSGHHHNHHESEIHHVGGEHQ
jgi:hypothetical protein